MSKPATAAELRFGLAEFRATLVASRFLRRVLAGIVTVNLLTLALVGQLFEQSRRQYEGQAASSTQSLAWLLERQLSGIIEKVDLALAAAADEHQRLQAQGALSTTAMNAYLARLHQRLPVLDAMRMADADGFLLYGSDVTASTRVNIADRPHFIRLRTDASAGLVVSTPQRSRINNKWVLVLGRRATAPDGSFAGMIFAALEIDALTTTFAKIDVGRHGTVSLRDAELRVLARHPVPPGSEQVIGHSLEVPELRALLASGQSAGSYRTRHTVDGIERQMAVHRVAGQPLYLVVGRASAETLAPWWAQLKRTALLLLLFCGATLALAWLLARDIHARLRTEREVRDLNQELEGRVAQRTEQLQVANRELEEFSYSMSHDLRTPLRAIAGYARILMEDYGAKLGVEGQRQLDAVQHNAVAMGRLIDGILDFLRLGRCRMDPATLDIGAMVQDIFTRLAAACPERRIQLELGPLPAAWGDPAMVRMALEHLLSNAIKFTRPRAEARVTVEGEDGAECTTYRIRDNGVGFNMDYRDKLFKVFERVHAQGEFEGSAIGLALVKRIIVRHGGQVWAEGKVDAGATLCFTLPHRENP